MLAINATAAELTFQSTADLVDGPIDAILQFTAEDSGTATEMLTVATTPERLVTHYPAIVRGSEQPVLATIRRVVPDIESGLGITFVITLTATQYGVSESIDDDLAHMPLVNPPDLFRVPTILSRSELLAALAENAAIGITQHLLVVEVDRHAHLSEEFGDTAGSDIATVTANRIMGLLGPNDLLARFGPAMFVIAVAPEGAARPLASVADELRAATAYPIAYRNASIPMTCSVAFGYLGADVDPLSFVAQCERTLRHARARGGNHTIGLSPDIDSTVERRQAIIDGFSPAIERQELSVAYQPVMSTFTGEVLFCEALLRWHHPQLGTIAPTEFIPIAEECGRTSDLGTWILDAACMDLARWRRSKPHLRLSVNLAATQLMNPDAVGLVMETLARYDLPPSALIIELTESSLVDDSSAAENALHQLHQLGLQLALDDFGTGYSSLRTLRRFPFSILKLDGSFVEGLQSDDEDWSVVRSVVSLAESLGMVAVAEQVETMAQFDRLADIGCPFIQGYYIATPQPARDIDAIVHAWHVLAP